MAVRQAVAIAVGEGGGTAAARREALSFARAIGLGDADLGRVGLVVTEAATNIEKHARRGTILVSMVPASRAVQILALDKGPGFDVPLSLRDGHSTAGSPGTGLGAIARNARYLDIYAPVGGGTVLLAEIGEPDRAAATSGGVLSGFSVPVGGETESGDGWSVAPDSRRMRLLVADGLGHGPVAAAVARQAVETFDALGEATPAESVERVHLALRGTRGASVAVAELDEERGVVRFCGVGNISCTVVLGNESRHLVSHNGTAGHEVRRIQEFEAKWESGTFVLLASDGLSTRWDLDSYPGLIRHHPAVVAGVLFRDFRRERDDVTVVAGRKGAVLSMTGGGA